MTCINKRTHISEEECKKKCSDMSTVDIGIGHDNNFVISQLFNIKFVTDTCSECGNDRNKLFVGNDLIKS